MKNRPFVLISIVFVFSIVVVLVLFLFSQDINHERNSFVRLMPPHPVTFSKSLDLNANSYYFAGASSTQIFLGNLRKPFHVLVLSGDLSDTVEQKISVEKVKVLRSTHTRIAVDSPNFYLMNGLLRITLRGQISDWIAKRYLTDSTFFIESVPISTQSLAIKSVYHTKENVLGKVWNGSPSITVKQGILKQQKEGLFSTDGMLHYDKEIARLLYLYYYRNQFICMDSNLNVLYEGKTIDTVTQARVKVSRISSENKYSLSAPPMVVNKSSCVAGNMLFVNSALLSKNESESLFKKASVIDVYDLTNGVYKFSFYIFDHLGEKVSSFTVTDKELIALHGHFIVTYKLGNNYFAPDDKK